MPKSRAEVMDCLYEALDNIEETVNNELYYRRENITPVLDDNELWELRQLGCNLKGFIEGMEK